MKRQLKFVITFALLITLMCTTTAVDYLASTSTEIVVIINDKRIQFGNDKPFLGGDDVPMVPVEALASPLRYSVEKRDGGKIVELVRQEPYTKITLEVGKSSVIFETSNATEDVLFDATAEQLGDSTYFPVKYVSRLLNYNLNWDLTRREISIDTHTSAGNGNPAPTPPPKGEITVPVTPSDKGTTPAQNTEVEISPSIDPKNIIQKWLDVPYASVSSIQTMNIFLPNEGEGPFPVIIMIHSGAFVSGNKKNVYLHGVDQGYAVVSVGYRLAPEDKFPAQINDIKAAIRFLRANAATYSLDPDKFAVWGSSSGGMLAALAGTSGGVKELQDDSLGNADQSDRVQAVIDYCGGVKTQNEALYKSAKGTPELEIEYRTAWAETYITPDDPPFFIVHGTADESIPIAHSAEFYEKLKAVIGEENVVFDPVEGARHDSSLVSNFDPIEFLDKHLKGITKPSEPSKNGDVKSQPRLKLILILGSRDIVVNGQNRTADVAPQAVNGRTLVPLRFIAETMGAEVDWIEASKTAVVVLEGLRIELPIGFVNPSIGLDVPAQLLNGRTMVPLRYISETLGATVEYFAETNSVEIVRK